MLKLVESNISKTQSSKNIKSFLRKTSALTIELDLFTKIIISFRE